MVTLTRGQVGLVVVSLVALLALGGSRLAGVGRTSRSPAQAAPLVAAGSSSGAGGGAADAAGGPRVVVHVVGAVRHAGLYRLADGSRVADAVRRAGGATPRAALALVNLAAPLADGMQVVVPERAAPGAAAPADGSAAVPARVSLASATVEQLDELPGIGPVTAQKIVDWRQTHGAFSSVDDLDQIPGIGPARLEQLRDLVTP